LHFNLDFLLLLYVFQLLNSFVELLLLLLTVVLTLFSLGLLVLVDFRPHFSHKLQSSVDLVVVLEFVCALSADNLLDLGLSLGLLIDLHQLRVEIVFVLGRLVELTQLFLPLFVLFLQLLLSDGL
jgi:hypothetical protein